MYIRKDKSQKFVTNSIMNKIEESKRLASILSNARYNSNVSQEEMAMSLGVSKNTIYNFEKGTSTPNIAQFMNWFKTLGLNPTSYILQYFNPNEFENIEASDSDEKIEKALDLLIHELTIEQKRGLLYWWYGSHNSDPNSVLQLILADLHTPLANRVNIARTIIDNFEMCEKLGTLVGTEHIMPDMSNLRDAARSAKTAVMDGKDGYAK